MMSQTNGPAAIITTSLTHRPFIIRAARIMRFIILNLWPLLAAKVSAGKKRFSEDSLLLNCV